MPVRAATVRERGVSPAPSPVVSNMKSAWGLLNLLMDKPFHRRYPHAPRLFYDHAGRRPPHGPGRLAASPALQALRPPRLRRPPAGLAVAGRRPALLALGHRPPLPLRLQPRDRPQSRPRQPARRRHADAAAGRGAAPPQRPPAAAPLGGRPGLA